VIRFEGGLQRTTVLPDTKDVDRVLQEALPFLRLPWFDLDVRQPGGRLSEIAQYRRGSQELLL
jgi:hypothetical protein